MSKLKWAGALSALSFTVAGCHRSGWGKPVTGVAYFRMYQAQAPEAMPAGRKPFKVSAHRRVQTESGLVAGANNRMANVGISR